MKDKIEAMLREMLDDATRVYRSNSKAGTDSTSTAFDAGRVNAFQQVLDAVERMKP